MRKRILNSITKFPCRYVAQKKTFYNTETVRRFFLSVFKHKDIFPELMRLISRTRPSSSKVKMFRYSMLSRQKANRLFFLFFFILLEQKHSKMLSGCEELLCREKWPYLKLNAAKLDLKSHFYRKFNFVEERSGSKVSWHRS